MSRALAAALLAVLVAAPAAAAPPARLQVVAREFSFALSRPKLKAGPAIVELVNLGQDAHDLRLRRVGGTTIYAIPVVRPGSHASLRVKLRAGRYRLWCSVADHRALGMRAALVVRR
jgi:plastocyanin